MKAPKNNPYIQEPELEFRPISQLSERDAEEQVELLREAIEYHDYRYYIENSPAISDKAYDRLFNRLKQLEQEFELETSSSPTQRVGGEPLEQLETREHVVDMLSLDSSEDLEEVRAFDRRVRSELGNVKYSMEPKFDGFSVEVVYENGELDRAVTRGNGLVGEDVTENVTTISAVPLRIRGAPEKLVLRAEIYMPKDGFQELNAERIERGKEAFANPRNAAAGTVRQLDPQVVASRPLNIYFYDIVQISAELESQAEAFELMESMGLRTNKYNRAAESIEDFIEYREELMERRDELNYDIDGVVAKVNDFGKRQELGVTAHHPRWAFAYKFPAKKGVTAVRKIVVQVGRTGKLTPVALLDPVDVGGVTVSRATLHNAHQIRELGVTEGSKVRIERAGDVIPEVVEVLKDNGPDFEMPSNCPVCGSPVEHEGKYHFCTGGGSCPAQLKRSLQHYASKPAMDIEGIGEKVADQLVESGLVKGLVDLYRLEKYDLTRLERFGERSSENLLEEINSSRETDLDRFIFSLGIRHVGREVARDLAENFSLEDLRNADTSDLKNVEGVGSKIADSINSFFESESGQRLVKELLEHVKPSRKQRNKELEGLKLVFTGSLEGFTRREITELMSRNGADVTAAVSSETDFLVAGEKPGENKLEAARQNGVKIIDEEEFEQSILSRIGYF